MQTRYDADTIFDLAWSQCTAASRQAGVFERNLPEVEILDTRRVPEQKEVEEEEEELKKSASPFEEKKFLALIAHPFLLFLSWPGWGRCFLFAITIHSRGRTRTAGCFRSIGSRPHAACSHIT